MDQSKEHSRLVNECLVELSRAGVFAWKNHTGRARSFAGNVMSFGLKGSADILAVLPPYGRFAAIEIKTGDGKQRKTQQKFEKAVLSKGGLYVVARSVDDALAIVELEKDRG